MAEKIKTIQLINKIDGLHMLPEAANDYRKSENNLEIHNQQFCTHRIPVETIIEEVMRGLP